MADQIKIRALLQGEIADIRILMQHPMETGQRKDETGKAFPANYIQTFTVSLNGKPVIEGQLNTSVSKNPLFAFRGRGIKVGDKLMVTWLDNLGEKRQDEYIVA
jgi:sulfur-oxidizing protein SoxZ